MVLLLAAPDGIAVEKELRSVTVPKSAAQEGGQKLYVSPRQPVTMTSSAWSDVVLRVVRASAERSNATREWDLN